MDNLYEQIEEAEGRAQLFSVLPSNSSWKRVQLKATEVIVIEMEGQKYIIDDPDYPSLTNAEKWIWQQWDLCSLVDIPDFSNEFWHGNELISPLYHATKSVNEEMIKKEGLRPGNRTRGLSNRSMGSAIFTSKEQYGLSSYGDLLIEIDTYQMKNDGYCPEVSPEDPIEDAQYRSLLAEKLGVEIDTMSSLSSEGIFENTVVFYETIPPKYLKMP